MSTDMKGIFQESLFGQGLLISVAVSESNRYRVLANVLPWPNMAEVADKFRSEKVSLINGRPLDMRLHLGAYVAQSMNGWTDRETEEMVRYHAGVRMLCGLEESTASIDRTSIEKFRNQVGLSGAEQLNQIVVQHAMGAGFTGSELCASDTTVQEAPIQHPTEVGHMKKIAEKLKGIGQKLGAKAKAAMNNLAQRAHEIFTDIRLFTRGKAQKAIERKKKLSLELHKTVSRMLDVAKANLNHVGQKSIQNQIELYDLMLKQILQWLKTSKHPANKLISLWEMKARAITRGKAAKAVEFGRRWIITRLLGGYVTGTTCQKLGGDADTKIAEEVLINFLDTTGDVPESFVYDRGGDGPKNHELLEMMGVLNNCIFLKGQDKMPVANCVFEMARRERPLTEASIATLKHKRYGFTKPRARTMDGCTLKGYAAMFGFNTNHLCKDVISTWGMAVEIS